MASTTHAQVPQPLIQIGRIGWAVRGLVYLAFGAVVWAVVMADNGSRAADTKGGIDLIADLVPDFWLYGIGAGLVAYAVWRLVEAVLPYGDWRGKALVERAGFLVSFVIYSSLAFVSYAIATSDSGSGSGGGSGSSGIASGLLSNPAGRVLFGVVGLVVIGAGLRFAKHGITREFEDHLDESRLLADGSIVTPLGVAGYIARSIVYAVFGSFVVYAALTYDPEKAGGVDRALTEVGQTGWGRPLLGLTAVGLLAYGLFCLASAPAQQLESPRAD